MAKYVIHSVDEESIVVTVDGGETLFVAIGSLKTEAEARAAIDLKVKALPVKAAIPASIKEMAGKSFDTK